MAVLTFLHALDPGVGSDWRRVEATAKAQADNDLSKMLNERRAEQGEGAFGGKDGVNWLNGLISVWGGHADKVKDYGLREGQKDGGDVEKGMVA